MRTIEYKDGGGVILAIFFAYVLCGWPLLAVTALTLNPTVEFLISTGRPTNELSAEIETQPLTAEIKTKKMFEVI